MKLDRKSLMERAGLPITAVKHVVPTRKILKEKVQDAEDRSGQKPKEEPPKEVTITDPKIIEDMWKDWLPGYYLMKGGSSYETGPAFGGNQKYSQFDPDKGGWVIYSND